MIEVFNPTIDVDAFFLRAMGPGYSMQGGLVLPAVTEAVGRELKSVDLLQDLVELEPTSTISYDKMPVTRLLHTALNSRISNIEGVSRNHLPYFSVRVFEPGVHGTTIHRNDPSVGPWAVGVTLFGEAPFDVYEQEQLPQGEITPLVGDGLDPEPSDSMIADAGAAWILYTRRQQRPHSSGIVSSQAERALILFYRTAWS